MGNGLFDEEKPASNKEPMRTQIKIEEGNFSEQIADSYKRKTAMVLTLDLQDFLLRGRVLKLYRQALRIARRAPDGSSDELRQIIRQEIENNRTCNDRQRIRFLISDGLERLKRLDETLDMQVPFSTGSISFAREPNFLSFIFNFSISLGWEIPEPRVSAGRSLVSACSSGVCLVPSKADTLEKNGTFPSSRFSTREVTSFYKGVSLLPPKQKLRRRAG
ncbi:Hypothetical predicted protein [Olea europaea subsp. europaea]|uniref:LYR motif-containing protein 2 n=1 Tax=Olea europaea subsp. europaea TaxID=158383 RepID=A0A8S0VEL3_OLEEU|nr:Hypothetical predicted protein [Olea europaea subsp. europaea]